ncbi:N-6 DNA methylase [Microbacterium hydrothermale]|uniref:N-6 DNA methylase n=1 Tax=Microbacterium hydrothermale TaxID=857427 RepID=UPI00142D6080|nr:N-6 DNA methylase [Microbacterium hydrothermale]
MTLAETFARPLLGTAGSVSESELELAAQFDRLHQLLYTKGGVRPTNAAIEEVGKLLFLRLVAVREGDHGSTSLAARLFQGGIEGEPLVAAAKRAFTDALSRSEFHVRDAEGGGHPLWPLDEPFRLMNAEVLQEAVSIVDVVVSGDSRVGDPMGTAFDAFLSGRYDHAGGLGTFLTPSGVARMMAEVAFSIADPTDKWDGHSPVVLDPFCGTGRFLVAAFDVASARTPDDSEALRQLLENGLVGADQSATAVAKTALNLMLYGAQHPRAWAVRDSMTDPHLDRVEGSFRLILTNPPFGGGKYTDSEGIVRTRRLLPVRGNAIDPALAGLARCLDLLADGGVLGIVLPDGLLSGSTFTDFLTRPDFSVVASISLPTPTFALSGTVAKTSAVFIQRSTRRAHTVLARVDHVGFLKQAGKAVADPAGSELEAVSKSICATFSRPLLGPAVHTLLRAPLVASVPSDGLASVDPSRLDPAAIEGRASLLAEGGMELGEILRAAPRLRRRIREREPFVSILHVDQLGTVSWNETLDYNPTTPGQWASAGDVLVSLLNPSKLRAAVIAEDYPTVMCSAEFGVFKPSIDPYALLALLYEPRVQAQLRPLGTGTSSSRRRIGPEDVLALIVPQKTPSEIAEIGERSRREVRNIESSRLRLTALRRSL